MYLTSWSDATHNTEKQRERQQRASKEQIQILNLDLKSYHATAQSLDGSETYQTSICDCTCPDFQHRRFPCKHMYALDVELQRRQPPMPVPARSRVQALQSTSAAQEVEKRPAGLSSFFSRLFRRKRLEPSEKQHADATTAVKPYDAFSAQLNAIPQEEIHPVAKCSKRLPIKEMPEIVFCNRVVKSQLFPLVVLDTETTGLSPTKNEIIELSAIRFEAGFVPVAAYTTLCAAREPIPSAASAVNGITDEAVAGHPFFGQLVQDFASFIAGCNIAGHNISFDLRMLHCGGLPLSTEVRYYDTLQLARSRVHAVSDYKLDTLCRHFKIARSHSHESLSDAYATALVFQSMI